MGSRDTFYADLAKSDLLVTYAKELEAKCKSEVVTAVRHKLQATMATSSVGQALVTEGELEKKYREERDGVRFLKNFVDDTTIPSQWEREGPLAQRFLVDQSSAFVELDALEIKLDGIVQLLSGNRMFMGKLEALKAELSSIPTPKFEYIRTLFKAYRDTDGQDDEPNRDGTVADGQPEAS